MNQKTLWIIIIVIILVLLGAWAVSARRGDTNEDTNATTTPNATTSALMEEEDLQDGTYTLDTNESEIRWAGSKTLIPNYKDSGIVKLQSGSAVVENGRVVRGDFVVDMNSIDAQLTSNTKVGVDRLETHLKSEDFFNVEKYPTATFTIKHVADGVVIGDLTVLGITQEISFPAQISMEGEELSANAIVTIDRTEWGIKFGSGKFFQDLGDSVIDDEVTIELDLHADRSI